MGKKKFIVISTLLMLTIIPNTIAKADYTGGVWTSDFNCNINTSSYYGNAYNAILAWNSTLDSIGSNIDIGVSVSSSSVDILQTYRTDVPWAGLTYIYPYQGASNYTSADIQLNEYYLKDMTSAWRTSTAVHEMGHVLGLGETSNYSYPNNKNISVMISDYSYRLKYNIQSIQTYDINQLNGIY